MDLLREFLRNKSLPQLVMIGAILLLFISQFFLYMNDANTGMLSVDADFNTVGTYWFGTQGTGWDLHPQAYVILVVLAFAFLKDDFTDSSLFRRFGYWAGAALVFACLMPGAPFRDAPGAALGFIAFFIAVAAAVMNWRSNRKAAPVTAPPSSGPKA